MLELMDVEDGLGNIPKSRSPSKCDKMKLYVTVALLVLVFIYSTIVSTLYASTQVCNDNPQINITDIDNIYLSQPSTPSDEKLICGISGHHRGNWEKFPMSASKASPSVYYVNFNTSINQANFVYYISTKGQSCSSSNIKIDPYGEDSLRSGDYTNSGYDKGHLVPSADLGCDTNYMSNMVPMAPNLNRKMWSGSEAEIRYGYTGYLVYKGCEYDGNFFMGAQTNNKVYIPTGCYYMVLNLTPSVPEENLYFEGLEILDYGYYANTNNTVRERRLPDWVTCHS